MLATSELSRKLWAPEACGLAGWQTYGLVGWNPGGETGFPCTGRDFLFCCQDHSLGKASFNQKCWEKLDILFIRKTSTGPLSQTIIKINSKWIKNLNFRTNTKNTRKGTQVMKRQPAQQERRAANQTAKAHTNDTRENLLLGAGDIDLQDWPPGLTWWKERNDFCKLSSDFNTRAVEPMHTCTFTHAHTHIHTIIHVKKMFNLLPYKEQKSQQNSQMSKGLNSHLAKDYIKTDYELM